MTQSPGDVLARRFRVQGAACRHLGSLLYADLMESAAADVESGGLLREVLHGWEGAPGEAALALRLFGTVHRLVLEGSAPELARFYPSAGGTDDPGPGAARAWEAFAAVVAANEKRCRDELDRPPQTNEVGRSAALMPGFVAAHRVSGLPLSLAEVGASAGLNLHWDSFSYGGADGVEVGDPDSPVRFPGPWYPSGLAPLLGGADRLPPVRDRGGCDRSPIDISGTDGDVGALTLCSYVWPDQAERLARLRGAIEVARRSPFVVETADAVSWITDRLASPEAGTCTVVVHSIFLQYLSVDERRSFEGAVRAAGDRATRDAPVAWLAMEPARASAADRAAARWEGGKAAVRLTVWPGGRQTAVADTGFHGSPVLPASP